jgi:RNA polymerase sigma-54 factor
MQMKQKTQLTQILLPQLRQSLKILALSMPDLQHLIAEELENNPFLEENQTQNATLKPKPLSADVERMRNSPITDEDWDPMSLVTKKATLHDILLRQLGVVANTDCELNIGQEIIGNIDDNGYLQATLDEIAKATDATIEKIEHVLSLIQKCEPAGVACRSLAECLLIQLDIANDQDPLVRAIICSHLDDVAKKNYTHIAKALKVSSEDIEAGVKKILRLDPKPGRNYVQEQIHNIIPDIVIQDVGGDLEISINNEDIPDLEISKEYRKILKDPGLDAQTKEFMRQKLRSALELLRSISKRNKTLRKVVDLLAQIQYEAIVHDLSHLKPLTLDEVAVQIGVHETTICRVVMNKYVQVPHGVIALKDFFTSHVYDHNGQAVSAAFVKRRIKESIDAEDKKHPLSDEEIGEILARENSLKIARRTVAKYREESKILSSPFRKER